MMTHLSPASIQRLWDDGRYDEALAGFAAYLVIVPYDADAMADYADCLAYQGDFSAAEKWARAAVKLCPEDERLLVVLGGILEDVGQVEETIALYIRADSLNPGNPSILRDLAGAYMTGGRYDQAAQILDGLVSRSPDDAALREQLGLALWFDDRPEEAIPELQKALELEKTRGAARSSLPGPSPGRSRRPGPRQMPIHLRKRDRHLHSECPRETGPGSSPGMGAAC